MVCAKVQICLVVWEGGQKLCFSFSVPTNEGYELKKETGHPYVSEWEVQLEQLSRSLRGGSQWQCGTSPSPPPLAD